MRIGASDAASGEAEGRPTRSSRAWSGFLLFDDVLKDCTDHTSLGETRFIATS